MLIITRNIELRFILVLTFYPDLSLSLSLLLVHACVYLCATYGLSHCLARYHHGGVRPVRARSLLCRTGAAADLAGAGGDTLCLGGGYRRVWHQLRVW